MGNAFTELGNGFGNVTKFPGQAYRLGQNILDPNVNILGKPNPQVLGDSTTTAPNYGPTQLAPNTTDPSTFRQTSGPAQNGGGGTQAASDAAERNATLFGIDQRLSGAESGLSNLGRQRDVGLGNIDRDYQSEYDVLTGNRSRNNARYDKQQTSQLNEYGARRNNNNMEAASWLQGAQSRLGAQGAGGGSAARYALPFQAQTQATQANAGAQATNTTNMQAIAGSRQQDEDQFVNAGNNLNDQRERGRSDFLGGLAGTEANLLSEIGGLRGQREIANGGDFRAAQNASNPYTSRIEALLAQINNYSATPAIKAQQVTTGRPDLSQYNWARPEAAAMPQQDPGLQGNNVINPYQDEQRDPILSLFGLDDRRQYA